MFKPILATLMTLGGLVVVWITADAKYRESWLLPCVLIVLAGVGEVMIWLEHFEHRADVAREQERADTLQADLKTARTELQATREEVAKLRVEETAREPKLTYLEERTRWQTDAKTGRQYASYVFRAKPSGPLRDIHIKLAFDAPFAVTSARIQGALVEEVGSRLEPLPGDRGLIYSTGVLREGNDIVIQVAADLELVLQSFSASP